MKTKFIILLTILSGLIYCSNAFSWTARYTVSYPGTKYSVIKITGAYNTAIDSGIGPIIVNPVDCHSRPKKYIFEGTMNASNFFMFTRRYTTDGTTNDTTTLKVIDLENVTITAYKGHLSGQNSSYDGDYGVSEKVYTYNNANVKVRGSDANRLSSYAISDFNKGVFGALQTIILPKTITSVSFEFICNRYLNRKYHMLDTIKVTNTTSIVNVTADTVANYFETIDGDSDWQRYLNHAYIYSTDGLWTVTGYSTDSVVALVPNNLLSKYKKADCWKTLKLIGYGVTTNIQQITSDESKPKIYPTLVTNNLNISGINQGNVIIYDLNGNAILRKEVQPQIDVSDLPKGIYLVSINNLCIGKIVK